MSDAIIIAVSCGTTQSDLKHEEHQAIFDGIAYFQSSYNTLVSFLLVTTFI